MLDSRTTTAATRAFSLTAALAISLAMLLSASASANKAAAVDLPDQVTYAEHVAEVLNRNCSTCHRPNDIAPMSLLSYQEARPWAKSILQAVQSGAMPPWHANPDHGDFSNDRSLDEREIALIQRWVKQGAPAGDLAAAPQPELLSENWRLGQPDMIITFDQVEIPADGPDVFHDLVGKTGLTEDRWLRALEVLPGDRRVVHHVIAFASAGTEEPSSGWLGAWAAGMDPMVFPEGTGKLLKAGDNVIADMHYHPAGEKITDQTKVGLYFHDGDPDKELINLWVQNGTFKIPAGAEYHQVTSSHTFDQDSTVYGLLPHMHYRGKDFRYTAIYPDGREEILLQVDDYDFNWQTLYELAEPIKMPKGSRIDCVAHFDNSTNNPDNPDPTRDVTFGNESYDEMMIGFVDYVVDEGRSPMTVEQRIQAKRVDLAQAHPGEVYDVMLGDGDSKIASVLHLPKAGSGTWYVAVNGQVMEGKLGQLERTAEGLTAKLDLSLGVLDVVAGFTGDAINGVATMGEQKIPFSGALID